MTCSKFDYFYFLNTINIKKRILNFTFQGLEELEAEENEENASEMSQVSSITKRSAKSGKIPKKSN